MRRMRRPIGVCIAWLIGCGYLAGQVRAQERPLFVEQIDVEVVNLDVFVTDSRGEPVLDLGAEDFEILENGQVVELSNFLAIGSEADPAALELPDSDSGLPPATRGPAPTEAAAESTSQPAPTLAESLGKPQDEPLRLILYLDFFNLQPGSRARLISQLDPFLVQAVGRRQPVMLVGFNRTLRIYHGFSRELGSLRSALQDMAQQATYRQQQNSLRRQVLRRMAADVEGAQQAGPTSSSSGTECSAYDALRHYAQQAEGDLETSLRGLRYMVQSLAGLSGRKALFYVSEGLPQRPAEDLYEALQNMGDAAGVSFASCGAGPLIQEMLSRDKGAEYRRLGQEANAHQVAFYTLDVRGPSGDSLMSAELPSFGLSGSGRLAVDNARTLGFQEPLLALASDTGGQAMLNTFNFDRVLAAASRDFISYYSLGYRRPQPRQEGFQRIEVRVRRPGLKVRHRSGYLAKAPEQRVADRMVSSLVLAPSGNSSSASTAVGLQAASNGNPHGISVDLGKPRKQRRGIYHVPLLVRIPFEELLLVPNGQNLEGRLRLYLMVANDEGYSSELQEIPYPVVVPQAQLAATRGRELGYQSELKVRAGQQRFLIGVWDELAGLESQVTVQLEVGGKGRKRQRQARSD